MGISLIAEFFPKSGSPLCRILAGKGRCEARRTINEARHVSVGNVGVSIFGLGDTLDWKRRLRLHQGRAAIAREARTQERVRRLVRLNTVSHWLPQRDLSSLYNLPYEVRPPGGIVRLRAATKSGSEYQASSDPTGACASIADY